MFMVGIIFTSQWFLVRFTPHKWTKSSWLVKKVCKSICFFTTWQSCFPTVKTTACKRGCLFHVVPSKTKSGCFFKVWPSHWLKMNKNFKSTIKRQLSIISNIFSLFFFFISISFYSFFFQFSFNIKCTSSYMHHETCCKICHNKHQSKWQRHWSLGFVFRFPPAE